LIIHPWLNSDAKKIGITIDKGTEIMYAYYVCIPFILCVPAAILNPSSDIADWQRSLSTDINIELG